MTPEAQRLAIATHCGWTNIVLASGQLIGTTPFDSDGMDDVQVKRTLPDYTRDLNAMHYAEMKLTPDQGETWAGLLCDMTDKYDGDAWKHAAYALAHASAAQRAEAFLKTLGLWKQ